MAYTVQDIEIDLLTEDGVFTLEMKQCLTTNDFFIYESQFELFKGWRNKRFVSTDGEVRIKSRYTVDDLSEVNDVLNIKES